MASWWCSAGWLGDQPLGVLALGMQRVGGDHPPGKVQPLEQRPELGDLVGLAVHVGLGQDRTGGVVHHRQQVHLRPAVVAGAAQGLAVDRDRPPRRPGCRWRPGGRCRGLLVGQPSADRAVERVGVDAAQHAAHGGLTWWPPGAGPRVMAHPQRGQHLAGRVAGPLADRGQGPRAGQHRAHRHGQHRDQCVPSAPPVAWVGDLGEVVEQVMALVGCQRGGRSQPLGNSRNRR